MKKFTFIFAMGVVVASLSAIVACNNSTQASAGEVIISQDSLVKLGAYLVNSIGCDDCHSPKKFGPNGPEIIEELRFSRHPSGSVLPKVDTNVAKQGWMLFAPDLTAFVGPWGMSYAANITSHETGIGLWSEEQFIYAIREGKLKGLKESRPLLPPMPWPQYRNLKDQDLKAIFAFLKSTKPVENRVPGWKKWNEL